MNEFKVKFIEGPNEFASGLGINSEREEILKETVRDAFKKGETPDSINLAVVIETASEVAETKGELVWLCTQIGGKFQTMREHNDPMAMLAKLMRQG